MDTQPQALWTELSNVLNSPWLGPSRTPNHFDEQLKKSCKERPRNLWLDKGFKAWFAYIQTDQKTRSAIDSLDEPSRKEGAESLGKIIPHLTVQNLFQHILYEANRGKDRRGKYLPSTNQSFYTDNSKLYCRTMGLLTQKAKMKTCPIVTFHLGAQSPRPPPLECSPRSLQATIRNLEGSYQPCTPCAHHTIHPYFLL